MKPLFQDETLRALSAYVNGTPTKVLCLVGPPGIGKSACVAYIANQYEKQIVTWDEDDDLAECLRTSSLRGPRLVVVDDAPVPASLVPLLLSQRAILLTTDLYDGPFHGLRHKLQLVRLHVYTAFEVASILKQRFSVSGEVLLAVANVCAPDVRYSETTLGYALSTAKAKRPGHKSILTVKDLNFDLFADVQRAFQGQHTSGVQSGDYFMYLAMLQTNAPVRATRLVKLLDGFSTLDILETSKSFSMEALHDFTASTLTAYTQPKSISLDMPKIPNPGSRATILKRAADTQSNDVETMYARIRSMDIPDRITAKHPWYDPDPDVRAARKRPFSSKTET